MRLVGRLSASGETDINTHANVDLDSSSVTSEILGDGPPRVIFYFCDLGAPHQGTTAAQKKKQTFECWIQENDKKRM